MNGYTFWGDNTAIFLFAELQIRGVIKYNSKIMFLFLNKNIGCYPSLELSRLGDSNDGSQNMLLFFYGEIWLIIPKLSLLSLLIRSTAFCLAFPQGQLFKERICSYWGKFFPVKVDLSLEILPWKQTGSHKSCLPLQKKSENTCWYTH